MDELEVPLFSGNRHMLTRRFGVDVHLRWWNGARDVHLLTGLKLRWMKHDLIVEISWNGEKFNLLQTWRVSQIVLTIFEIKNVENWIVANKLCDRCKCNDRDLTSKKHTWLEYIEYLWFDWPSAPHIFCPMSSSDISIEIMDLPTILNTILTMFNAIFFRADTMWTPQLRPWKPCDHDHPYQDGGFLKTKGGPLIHPYFHKIFQGISTMNFGIPSHDLGDLGHEPSLQLLVSWG